MKISSEWTTDESLKVVIMYQIDDPKISAAEQALWDLSKADGNRYSVLSPQAESGERQ